MCVLGHDQPGRGMNHIPFPSLLALNQQIERFTRASLLFTALAAMHINSYVIVTVAALASWANAGGRRKLQIPDATQNGNFAHDGHSGC